MLSVDHSNMCLSFQQGQTQLQPEHEENDCTALWPYGLITCPETNGGAVVPLAFVPFHPF